MNTFQAENDGADAVRNAAGVSLLRALAARGYQFVSPTPATQARVLCRSDHRQAKTLRDVFGWSLPFIPELLDPELQALMAQAGVITDVEGQHRSKVRVSSLDDYLFIHSAYPTDAEDAVFFGPDSYRFANFIRAEISRSDEAGVVVDIGAGSGVGAIIAAERRPKARLIMTDVNAQALRLAQVNASVAGLTVETLMTDGVRGVDAAIDLAIANPPYIIDPSGRAYRDGGDMHGGRLSLDLAAGAVAKLAPAGRLLMYTGSAILEGEDRLRAALAHLAAAHGCDFACRELDPDVFGEELDHPQYAEVERIALLGVSITKRA